MRRLALVLSGALAVGLAAFGLSSGCLRKSAPPAVTPVGASAASPVSPPPAIDAGAFDPSSIAPVVAHPALADASRALDAGDFAAAARAIDAARAASPPSADDDARWSYQTARLRALAGDTDGALAGWEAAAARAWPLAPYASLAAAQAHARAGRADEALARAAAVPDGLPCSWPARLVEADVLEARGAHDEAVARWRGYLAASRHPSRWIDVTLELSRALLDGDPDADRAREAAKLARRVLLEAPASGSLARAVELERRALARLPEPARPRTIGAASAPAEALDRDEQLVRATALAEAGHADQAVRAAEAIVTAGPASGDAVACRASLLVASSAARRRDRAHTADVYARAVTLCAGTPDALVEALYGGGKASASAGRCDEAIARFAQVERDFHDHRFADDARLRRAECALALGDEARFGELVVAMPDDFPRGDMVVEGLFRLALRRMVRGDWAGAVAPLERAAPFAGSERAHGTAGRVAYFHARALAVTGDRAGAVRELAAVVRDNPFSFYMLAAYTRLSELDPALARAALDAARASEPEGAFTVSDVAALHEPGWARATELLRQGDLDAARREIAQLGELGDDAGAQLAWAASLAYARVGATRLSFDVPRSRVSDWLGHWPTGRWRTAWELAFPRPFGAIVEREAKRSGIPASLAYAVMREESAFDPDAASGAHAYGLMQLIVPTAQMVGKKLGITPDEAALRRPETNVALGCRLLGQLRARFASAPALAVAAYNAGAGAPERWVAKRTTDEFDLWVEQIPYEETRKYLKRVLSSEGAYAFLYAPDTSQAEMLLPLRVP